MTRASLAAVAATYLTTLALGFGSASAQPNPSWTETFVRYAGDGEVVDRVGPYFRDDEDRQHMHILTAPNATGLTPVYFHAHGNGGNADMDDVALNNIVRSGYSVVSWESITKVDGEADVLQCMADFDLVLEWVKTSGKDYGLKDEDFIIGGRSRGSVCSFPGAQSLDPAIRGIYMYNALPSPDFPSTDFVSEQSPPLFFTYGPECPKPIITEGPDACVSIDPRTNTTDIHNPLLGQIVLDRYEELGIGSITHLEDGLYTRDVGIYSFFSLFVRALDQLD